MTKLRQDGWTREEDKWLEEAVLSHIRNGSTQLRAFEEIAQKVNRTAAACGFRWNSCIRKECQQQIDQAKKERYASRKAASAQPKVINNSPLEWSADEMTKQLSKWIERLSSYDQNADWKEKYQAASHSLETALREKEKLETKIQGLEEDYRALLYLIEKARKLGVAEGKEETYTEAPVFKMEPNGNLFRMNRSNSRAEQGEAVDI
ncbi:RsfA family transcriptional regulator [Jeotgalibacillus proteolyticus]|uniref:RsfA family transcriptional regulator n=1 Tax=Jeotgalibacillus proteolyticus TaxID=2082395 RepID=A0A2S5GGI6_9BACL|nr:RsfA family transcriptional regulator [Jeotgalibacillus proteolyticus]PPA72150.1 RsfA family transcriptional regulator [Jeotgalibacillus proteolyticus]